jgi:hypothetical protein
MHDYTIPGGVMILYCIAVSYHINDAGEIIATTTLASTLG